MVEQTPPHTTGLSSIVGLPDILDYPYPEPHVDPPNVTIEDAGSEGFDIELNAEPL